MPVQPFPGFSDPSVVFLMSAWLGLVAQSIPLRLFRRARSDDDGSIDGVPDARGYRTGTAGEVDIARRFHSRYSNESAAAKERIIGDVMRKRSCNRNMAMRWALGDFKH